MTKWTFDILQKVVQEAQCFPNWEFELVPEGDTWRLVIEIDARDNYRPEEPFTVRHYHPVPHTTYNEASWRRWMYERCRATMTHEIGEALRWGTLRPFVPMHGPGEDPYTAHEWRSETDARTTQRGTIREGDV